MLTAYRDIKGKLVRWAEMLKCFVLSEQSKNILLDIRT